MVNVNRQTAWDIVHSFMERVHADEQERKQHPEAGDECEPE